MQRFIIESEFTHCGYHCVVAFMPMGHRCGYVAIPQTHPMYKKEYDEDTEVQTLTVHGGVTFSGFGCHPMDSETWWIGFDCAHYGDGGDIDLAYNLGLIDLKSAFALKNMQRSAHAAGVVRDNEYVANECKCLAEQISDFANKEVI